MRGRLAWLLLCAGALGAGCASTPGAGRVAGDPDEYFMLWASQMNLAEIAAGEMASERAVNDAVRDYAEQMVQAHRRANEELQRLAEKNGVKLASRPDEAGERLTQHLGQLDGEAFDREYIGAMVANHASALEMFEERAGTASDPELREWARRKVPVLEHHLEEARSLQRKLENVTPAGAPLRIVPP